MAEQKRRNIVRNPESGGGQGTADAQAWLASRLEMAVSSSVRDALQAAFQPANRTAMPLPFWWWVPPADAASAESLGGEAGVAVAEMEDVSRKNEKRAGKLAPALSPAGDLERQKVYDALRQELADARTAKNKVAGAAVAAKKFKDAKKGIVDAETSFDAADDLLDDYHDTPTDVNSVTAQNKRLKDAAEKIKHDVEHLKDALAAIV